MLAAQQQPPRVADRDTVSWPVSWLDGDGVAQRGLVCDISPRGLFIRPLAGSSVGALRSSMRVTLRIQPPGQPKATVIGGTIRWTGFHDKHKRGGIGVELEVPLSSRVRPRCTP